MPQVKFPVPPSGVSFQVNQFSLFYSALRFLPTLAFGDSTDSNPWGSPAPTGYSEYANANIYNQTLPLVSGGKRTLILCSGERPNQSDLRDYYVPTYTYADQQLCICEGAGHTSVSQVDSDQANNEMVATFGPYASLTFTPRLTGTATWWMLTHDGKYPTHYYTVPPIPLGGWITYVIAAGDISTTGGNGTLQLDDINLVSGQAITVPPITFRFPMHLTVR